MATTFEKMKRSWNGLLHGDTVGPFLLRRALPVLALVLIIVALNALQIVAWQWSVLTVVALTAIFIGLRKRNNATPAPVQKQPLSLPINEKTPQPQAQPQPEPDPQSQPVVTTTHVTTNYDPNPEEVKERYVDVSASQATIPKSVADTHKSLYDYHFRWPWFAERIWFAWFLFGLICAGIVYVATNSLVPELNNKIVTEVWSHAGDVVIVMLILVIIQTVFYWIKWQVTRFVVTQDTYSMPGAMPGPFTYKTPSIRVFDATYEIRQTWLDKILKTCRLIYDDKKESKLDDKFRVVKWLPVPDELRQALGSPPMKKLSLSESRRQRRESKRRTRGIR